ncbi:MAG: hypothetical protein KF803_07990 [Cyclobacteriaceae bacterium]|nr:hypothetical protein [Cyclobacteriaceae bacterium]
MRANFKELSDKFSNLNERDNEDFISFYGNYKNEILKLSDFDTDEELYLMVVINHTYGRSLLYGSKNYEKAEEYLEVARSLILNNRVKFSLDLTDDIWYLQTLQHLLKISLDLKNYNKSKELLKELKLIDNENVSEYNMEEKEINRIRRYKIFEMLIYCGMGLIAISMTYKFVTSVSMVFIDSLGIAIGLIGIIGGYFNKDSLKGTALKDKFVRSLK